MTPKHLRSSVWKYLGFYVVDGKVMEKDKVVCRLCEGSHLTLQQQQTCRLTTRLRQQRHHRQAAQNNFSPLIVYLQVTVNRMQPCGNMIPPAPADLRNEVIDFLSCTETILEDTKIGAFAKLFYTVIMIHQTMRL